VAPASPRNPASEPEPTSAATIQQDADRHLVTHFESVQAISTTTTTPSLLPMLLQSLTRNTDHKPLLELLRSGTLASNFFVPSPHLQLWMQGIRGSSAFAAILTLQMQSPSYYYLLDYFVCITRYLGMTSGRDQDLLTPITAAAAQTCNLPDSSLCLVQARRNGC